MDLRMFTLARARHALVLLAVPVAVCATACSVGETTYESVTQPVRAANLTRTCDSAFAKPDLSALESCGGGKGHCFDGTKISQTKLTACKGGDLCVPDKILASSGDKLKACTFFVGNKPGACLSTVVPDIAAHQDQLQRDVCDEGERCAPCIDPTNGQDTHLCDAIGVHEKACVGGVGAATATSCHVAGSSLNADAVPEDQRSSLHQDTCHTSKVCAPASLVDGHPVKCHALALSGVCIDVCFAGVLRAAGTTLRGDCGPTEVCLPCVVGAGQGVPGC